MKTKIALLAALVAASAAAQLIVNPAAPVAPTPITYRVTLDASNSLAVIQAFSQQVQLSQLNLTNLARLDVAATFVNNSNGLTGSLTFRQINLQ